MLDRNKPRLTLGRTEILAFRRTVGSLDQRLPAGQASLRRAAWAGLQDSMPRAALLSIHARVEGTTATALDDPSLVQIWGPRYSTYVVAAVDVAVFTLGRLPDGGAARHRAEDIASRLDAFLAGRVMGEKEAGRGVGVHPSALRYGAPTGRIRIRWDGARQPTVWTLPPPEVDPVDARGEMVRRYLHVFGPGTPESFADWAGVKPAVSRAAFADLEGSLVPVRTPIGDRWILGEDEKAVRGRRRSPVAPARLLPSGDTFFLLRGADRELLVPDASRRAMLWTPRVWPGAVLVDGEVAGVWRRAQAVVTVEPWQALTPAQRVAVEAEAASMPLPGLSGPIQVRWVS